MNPYAWRMPYYFILASPAELLECARRVILDFYVRTKVLIALGDLTQVLQLSRQPLRSYSIIASAIIIAGILIAASLFVAVGKAPKTTTSTTTNTALETETVTSTSVSTTTVTITSTYTQNALVASCSHLTNPGTGSYPRLFVSTNQTALLCVRVYYFNSNGTHTLNVSQALDMEAVEYPQNAQPIVFSGASNFTVTPSQDQLVIGGPDNENEGAEIAWALTAKPGASGSYELNFNSVSYVVGSGGPEECGSYGVVTAGNGEPSYLITGFQGCITYSTQNVTTNSTKYTVASFDGFASQVLINGDIYFLITGFTNSTQIGAVG